MSTDQVRIRRLNIPNPPKLLKLGHELSHLRAWDTRPGHENEIVVTDDYERTGDYGLTGPLRLYNPQVIGPIADPPYRQVWAVLDEKHKGPPYKVGGPFRMLKMNLNYDNKVYSFGRVESVPKDSTLVGGIMPPPEVLWEMGDLFQNPYAVSFNGGRYFSSLDDYHDRAWNKLKPKLEQAGGFVFLYELRDLPRSLETSAGFFKNAWQQWLTTPAVLRGRDWRRIGHVMPREVADHWINHQFGWAPFIADILKLRDTMLNVRAQANALAAENGKWVKKRVTVLDDFGSMMVRSVNSGNFIPGYTVTIPWKYLSGDVKYEIWDDYRYRIYATGEFSYYRPEFDSGRPDFDSAFNRLQQLLTLWGLRVTPAHLYAITPWSWLVDWFTGLGNWLGYLQDSFLDSLVGRECYIMKKTHITRSFRIAVPFKTGSRNFIFTREIVCKHRDPFSSPYGPSISWGGLSPRQLSILAALGLTRNIR